MRLKLMIAACALATTVAACEEDHDLGTLCGSPVDTWDEAPVKGEEPVTEVKRLERDGRCETFKCIHHGGYQPYCTRECSVAGSSEGTCFDETDCGTSETCFDGKCYEDDCPEGFRCQRLSESGALAESGYCVLREHCSRNLDCEDLERLECRKLGCTDVCNMQGDDCEWHLLGCEFFENLPCACADGSTDCVDAELICQQTGGEPWPELSVSTRNVCLPKDFE